MPSGKWRSRRKSRSSPCSANLAALAKDVGVTRQTIVAIEQGKYSPSLEVAFRIARVFSTPIDEVFFWQSDTQPNTGGNRE